MAKLTYNFILIFLNDIAIYLIIILSFAYFLFKNKFTFLKLTLTLILTFIFTYLVKNLVFLDRPYQLNNQIPPVLVVPKGSTFPSAHAAYAAALAITVFLYNKKTGLVFILTAFLIGLARILAHVHFVTDVITGLILGAFLALLVHFSLKSSKSKASPP